MVDHPDLAQAHSHIIQISMFISFSLEIAKIHNSQELISLMSLFKSNNYIYHFGVTAQNLTLSCLMLAFPAFSVSQFYLFKPDLHQIYQQFTFISSDVKKQLQEQVMGSLKGVYSTTTYY